MNRILKTAAMASALTFALLGASVACNDSVGPKPPSAKSNLVEVVSSMSKTTLGVGDTATFAYYVKNITAGNLTLTTDTGCQLAPTLDQVEGPRMDDLFLLNCPTTQTVRVLAPNEPTGFQVILRGYDKNKPVDQQKPGYLLTSGTFDASMLVTANELMGAVRSDWVRFTVK